MSNSKPAISVHFRAGVHSCGHATVTKAGRAAAEQGWQVDLTEHCLVGPTLASLIVCLTLRMRLSRPRIREFLKDWLGVDMAAGTIDRCVHEAGRASEPLEELTKAVYRPREGPPERPLPGQYAQRLAEFKALWESCRDCPQKKLQQLAREFLNDWEAIWIVLQYPNLPLTNDEAEQALRHLVIARKICQGTRSEEGTRAYALLATGMETCRKRKIPPWPYVARVIAERRTGNEASTLPAACLPGGRPPPEQARRTGKLNGYTQCSDRRSDRAQRHATASRHRRVCTSAHRGPKGALASSIATRASSRPGLRIAQLQRHVDVLLLRSYGHR